MKSGRDDKQRQGANMNKVGFATVNPSTGEEIEAFLGDSEHDATISADRRAGNGGGFARHQKSDHFGDLFRLLQPLDD